MMVSDAAQGPSGWRRAGGLLATPTDRWLVSMVVLFLVLMIPIWALRGSTYLSGPGLHATIEVVGSMMGLVVGLAFVLRFYALGSGMLLFVGLAFIVNAGEDLVHGGLAFVLDSQALGVGPSAIQRFVTGTHVNGRLLLGVILGCTPLLACKVRSRDRRGRDILVYSVVVGGLAVIGTVVEFSTSLPSFQYPELFFSRPIDLLSAGVLAVALLANIRVFIAQRDALFLWISLSLVISVAGQVTMSTSGVIFDAAFDLSHFYKAMGYLLPMVGVAVIQVSDVRGLLEANKVAERQTVVLEEAVRQSTLLNITSKIAVESENLIEALPRVLRGVRDALGWELGHAYLVSPTDGRLLVPSGIWSMPDGSGEVEVFARGSEGITFRWGEGLPGRVLAEGGLAWIADVAFDSNFPRADLACEAGLRGGVAFPVVVGGRVEAVLEFYSRERIEIHPEMAMTLGAVGLQIGSVIDRSQAAAQILHQKLALDEHAIVSSTDLEGNITYVNKKFCEISGYSVEELLGANHRIINSGEHPREFFGDLWKAISSGLVWSGEIKNRSKDGSCYWTDSTIVPCRDGSGRITQYFSIRTDITATKEYEAHLQEVNEVTAASNLAMVEALEGERVAMAGLAAAMAKLEVSASTDKLTGLANRAIFGDRLGQELKHSRRNGGRFAVLFFDFDRFKVVNDSLGHDVGDALLCDIARIFGRELRDSDTVARFGGDEFVVILADLTEWADAEAKARRLLEAFSVPREIGSHLIVSTASIGLVTNEMEYESPADMIRDADAAMYQAKESGKNRVVVFDRAMHESALARLSLEADLRGAIGEDQLELLYQPIVDLGSGQTSGFEALIRWNHPERGIVSPREFIPIAEDTGLIVEIGEWVLRSAAAQSAEWNGRLGADRRLKINVNVAKRQLLSPGFIESVERCRVEFGLGAGELQLEITESTIADERNDVAEVLNDLRRIGFPIAMDDFGTGMSSLSALHEYPIDVLKIDQAFIQMLDHDRSLFAVVTAITSLAENLGIQTVAEGIESEDIVASLQSIGCNWGQGYLFARPMDAGDAERYLFGEERARGSAA